MCRGVFVFGDFDHPHASVHFGQMVMSMVNTRLRSQGHRCLEGSGGGSRWPASPGMKSGS
jgi:hypothetical protein